MTRPAPEHSVDPFGGSSESVLLAGAERLDALAPAVSDFIVAAIPATATRLAIRATSLAPRDEAARAVRWVSRLGARRGLPTSALAPASVRIGAWGRDADPALSASARSAGTVSVGVSRLNLEPEIAAVVQPFAVGLWGAMLPPHSRLLARLAPDPVVAQVTAATDAAPAVSILVGANAGMAWAVVSRDLLAAEVLGRALRAIAQPIGDVGLSPWQAPVVQRGIELGAGVTHPDQIDIEMVWAGDNEPGGRELFERVAGKVAARAGIARVSSAA